MNLQIAIFNGTNLALVQAQVNAFLLTLYISKIHNIDFQAFLRGALTNFTYTVYYYL